VGVLGFQRWHHVDHVARVVAAAREVFGAQGLGLQFLVAAVVGDVAGRHALRHVLADIGRAADALAFQHRAEQAGGQHAEAGVLALRCALGAGRRGVR